MSVRAKIVRKVYYRDVAYSPVYIPVYDELTHRTEKKHKPQIIGALYCPIVRPVMSEESIRQIQQEMDYLKIRGSL